MFESIAKSGGGFTDLSGTYKVLQSVVDKYAKLALQDKELHDAYVKDGMKELSKTSSAGLSANDMAEWTTFKDKWVKASMESYKLRGISGTSEAALQIRQRINEYKGELDHFTAGAIATQKRARDLYAKVMGAKDDTYDNDQKTLAASILKMSSKDFEYHEIELTKRLNEPSEFKELEWMRNVVPIASFRTEKNLGNGQTETQSFNASKWYDISKKDGGDYKINILSEMEMGLSQRIPKVFYGAQKKMMVENEELRIAGHQNYNPDLGLITKRVTDLSGKNIADSELKYVVYEKAERLKMFDKRYTGRAISGTEKEVNPKTTFTDEVISAQKTGNWVNTTRIVGEMNEAGATQFTQAEMNNKVEANKKAVTRLQAEAKGGRPSEATTQSLEYLVDKKGKINPVMPPSYKLDGKVLKVVTLNVGTIADGSFYYFNQVRTVDLAKASYTVIQAALDPSKGISQTSYNPPSQ